MKQWCLCKEGGGGEGEETETKPKTMSNTDISVLGCTICWNQIYIFVAYTIWWHIGLHYIWLEWTGLCYLLAFTEQPSTGSELSCHTLPRIIGHFPYGISTTGLFVLRLFLKCTISNRISVANSYQSIFYSHHTKLNTYAYIFPIHERFRGLNWRKKYWRTFDINLCFSNQEMTTEEWQQQNDG